MIQRSLSLLVPASQCKRWPKKLVIGARWSHLVILELIGKINSTPIVRTKCDCGNEQLQDFYAIKFGQTKSCGCYGDRLVEEAKAKANTPERQAFHRLERSFMHIKQRCHDPKHHSFRNYGARGITVCDRWRFGEGWKSGWACFYSDMGDRPDGHTIERRDNNGPYSPDNCYWTPRPLQDRNKRTNRWLTLDGVRMLQIDAERILGLREKKFKKATRLKPHQKETWYKGHHIIMELSHAEAKEQERIRLGLPSFEEAEILCVEEVGIG